MSHNICLVCSHCRQVLYDDFSSASEICDLNITYNYSPFYYKYFDKELGIKWLNKKIAEITTYKLMTAIKEFKTNPDDINYKKEEEAKLILRKLLAFALANPGGIWSIS